MRRLAWRNEFDVVACWFTSFGYFDDRTRLPARAVGVSMVAPGPPPMCSGVHWGGPVTRSQLVTVQLAVAVVLCVYTARHHMWPPFAAVTLFGLLTMVEWVHLQTFRASIDRPMTRRLGRH